MMLSELQVSVAKALSRRKIWDNLDGPILLLTAEEPTLLVVYYAGVYDMRFRGYIHASFTLNHSVSMFINKRTRDVYISAAHTYQPLKLKTNKTLVQINHFWGVIGNDTHSRALITSNVPAAPFTLHDNDSIASSGLVFDTNTWRI